MAAKKSWCRGFVLSAVAISVAMSTAAGAASGTFSGASSETELPSAEELLERSIAYHDPQGLFLSAPHRLWLLETRPGGRDRRTELLVDVAGGRFEMVREGEETVAGYQSGGGKGAEGCRWTLNGRQDFSAEERTKHRLTCDRLIMMRDYYTYLWGLPMKFRDPGTRLGQVKKERFLEREALSLRVTYEEKVGGDIWYAYFDPESFALIGYRFYHDEAANDGEYIVLEGEVASGGLRLPARRAWYTHQGDEHLGTDVLLAIDGALTHLVSWRVDRYEDLPATVREYVDQEAPLWRQPPTSLEEIRKIQLGDEVTSGP